MSAFANKRHRGVAGGGTLRGAGIRPKRLDHDRRGRRALNSKRLTSRWDKEHKKAEQERREAALEEGLKGTFPASDAVAVTQPAPERSFSPDIELATQINVLAKETSATPND
jgi:hypothetical protein